MQDFKQHFLRRLVQSSSLAGLTVILGFGVYSYVQSDQTMSIWIVTLSILIGAVAFVAASTYMDRQGFHYTSCLAWGAVAAVSVTALSISIAVSAVYVAESGITPTMLSYIVLAFAFAIIGSSSALWVVKGRKEEPPVY